MFRIYLKKREKSEKERILSGALLPKHKSQAWVMLTQEVLNSVSPT